MDARLAEATKEEDRIGILSSIQQRPGGLDGLNARMQREQRVWLMEAAEGVLKRTDPHRPALTGADLAVEEASVGDGTWHRWGFLWPTGAKATRLLESLPQLPTVLRFKPVV